MAVPCEFTWGFVLKRHSLLNKNWFLQDYSASLTLHARVELVSVESRDGVAVIVPNVLLLLPLILYI